VRLLPQHTFLFWGPSLCWPARAMSEATTPPPKEEICQGDGKGLFLPLFGRDENAWNIHLRQVLYLFGLLYCFMGVAIIADVFMSAIEKITSKKKRVHEKDPIKGTGRWVTKTVWNPTVANLTLMALGSSAPEILLNVIFIFADGFFQEGLGPSTIVGSAAFNLFCISAVCVMAIPTGEVRRIKELSVYAVTASFSIFAYVWLIIILMVFSPNIVQIWEGVLTFLFFPVLVTVAFVADRGYFSGGVVKEDDRTLLDADMSKEEMAAVVARTRQQHGANLSDAQVMKLIEKENQAPKSRAQYRVGAVRELTGGKRVEANKAENALCSVVPAVDAYDDRTDVINKHLSIIDFECDVYTVMENAVSVKAPVIRRGDTNTKVRVDYKTRDGTAKASLDYEHVQGTLEFAPGDSEQIVEVPIIDDASLEIDECFYIDLSISDSSSMACLGDQKSMTIIIMDDDDPGILLFERESASVTEAAEDKALTILVKRKAGGSGRVTCKYRTEDDTAIANADYKPASGELVFKPGQTTASFDVMIHARGRYESTEQFRVIIEEVEGGAKFDKNTDGGSECCIMYVEILADSGAKESIDRMMSQFKINWDKTTVGTSNWKDQFKEAFFVNGGQDDDEAPPPGVLDYVMHALNLPWKLLCATVPPTDFLDGWACFCCSLAVIGLVTAIIGDMAGLLGCCLFGPGNDGITAITFVALGTSLPDTFASKTAALMDPHADASIGNVTGSNSVNVFLGLGLPWMIAAIYWPIAGASDDWKRKYLSKDFIEGFEKGALVVEDPGLGNSVLVFTICALACMATLLARRKLVGGELGGPDASKRATAAFFVSLWLVFILAYIFTN